MAIVTDPKTDQSAPPLMAELREKVHSLISTFAGSPTMSLQSSKFRNIKDQLNEMHRLNAHCIELQVQRKKAAVVVEVEAWEELMNLMGDINEALEQEVDSAVLQAEKEFDDYMAALSSTDKPTAHSVLKGLSDSE